MKKTTTAETVVKNINMLMQATGWNVQEVARQSKGRVKATTLYMILNGQRVPGVDTADDIASVWGLTGWLLLFPNLQYELAKNGKLEEIITKFSASTKSAQEYIQDILDRESKNGTEHD